LAIAGDFLVAIAAGDRIAAVRSNNDTIIPDLVFVAGSRLDVDARGNAGDRATLAVDDQAAIAGDGNTIEPAYVTGVANLAAGRCDKYPVAD
jgi:hypothetical protein